MVMEQIHFHWVSSCAHPSKQTNKVAYCGCLPVNRYKDAILLLARQASQRRLHVLNKTIYTILFCCH